MGSESELYKLEAAIEKIIVKAESFGLDFYDMFFEICPAEIIYTFGAYGMPTRFSHWSFGKNYHKMKTHYDYNLSRIYELVINNDPCYAFLLDGNTLIQNKMVAAHVLAHCDFFKNNAYFRYTQRKMVETMANSASRFRDYEFKYGKQKVESFLDAVIAISEHIDPYRYIKEIKPEKNNNKEKQGSRESLYDDLWQLDNIVPPEKESGEKPASHRVYPEKDLLLFMINKASDLEDWQRDIISVMRDEMMYFWPQMETKIMNEGWATYWHMRIMREMDLDEDEAIEFAKMHADVIQPSKTHINPYLLGLKIFENIEKRWDNPEEEEIKKYHRPSGEGRKKIFEVRETENDISFIRNYLTRELIEEMDLYLFKRIGYDWKIVDKSWERVRDSIVSSMTFCGFPYLVVQDGDYNRRGELYLKHRYEGMELDVFYLERTLPQVNKIWGRPVHLETVIDNKAVLYSYDGEKVAKKIL